jgi:hypothetical protein
MKTDKINSAAKLLLILLISTTTNMLGAKSGRKSVYQWPGGIMAGVPVAPNATGTSTQYLNQKIERLQNQWKELAQGIWTSALGA